MISSNQKQQAQFLNDLMAALPSMLQGVKIDTSEFPSQNEYEEDAKRRKTGNSSSASLKSTKGTNSKGGTKNENSSGPEDDENGEADSEMKDGSKGTGDSEA